ncbi:MAG: RNA polymerase sigma factor [Defluviitaleaceae bacterium]|nr:RNA polymerase sigma factor [Defluviitaleaceae bacterium]
MEYNLDELVSTYGEKLLRYAASILYNHQDAEDVVQDVFMSAYQNQTAFDGGNISAWLYKITYNKSINKLKRRKFLIFGNIPENTVAGPEQAGLSGLSEDTLYALGLLKPQDRALLYGRIMEGYSYDELSQQMGIPPAALRKRYERAKRKLAHHLTFDLEEKGAQI